MSHTNTNLKARNKCLKGLAVPSEICAGVCRQEWAARTCLSGQSTRLCVAAAQGCGSRGISLGSTCCGLGSWVVMQGTARVVVLREAWGRDVLGKLLKLGVHVPDLQHARGPLSMARLTEKHRWKTVIPPPGALPGSIACRGVQRCGQCAEAHWAALQGGHWKVGLV